MELIKDFDTKKILDICIFCGHEPTEECWKEHSDYIDPVYMENILTKKELKKVNNCSDCLNKE